MNKNAKRLTGAFLTWVLAISLICPGRTLRADERDDAKDGQASVSRNTVKIYLTKEDERDQIILCEKGISSNGVITKEKINGWVSEEPNYKKQQNSKDFESWMYYYEGKNGQHKQEEILGNSVSVNSTNIVFYGIWRDKNEERPNGEAKSAQDEKTEQRNDGKSESSINPSQKTSGQTSTVGLSLKGIKLKEQNIEQTWDVKKGDSLREIISALKNLKLKNVKKNNVIENGKNTDQILCWVDQNGVVVTDKTIVTGDMTLTPVWVRFTTKQSKGKTSLKMTVHGVEMNGKSKCGVTKKEKSKHKTTTTINVTQGAKKTITKTISNLTWGETYAINLLYNASGSADKVKPVSFQYVYKPDPPKTFQVGKYDKKKDEMVPIDITWKSKKFDGWEIWESQTGKKKDYKRIADYKVWLRRVNLGKKRARPGAKYKGRVYYIARDGKRIYSDWSAVATIK